MEFSSPDELLRHAKETGRSYVTMSLSHNGSEIGNMLIELFTDICPQTCKHFLDGVEGKFQSGFQYQGSPIHRVVKGAYIQGGDVVDGTGKGQPGFFLPDETFAVKHDTVGLIGLANNGEPHTASTQFYISLKAIPWLDGKRVLFGQVIDAGGLELLRKVEELPTNNERPLPEVVISAIQQVA